MPSQILPHDPSGFTPLESVPPTVNKFPKVPAGTVVKKLGKWLVEHGYVADESSSNMVELGKEASSELPAAEELAENVAVLLTFCLQPIDRQEKLFICISKEFAGQVPTQMQRCQDQDSETVTVCSGFRDGNHNRK